MAVVCLTTVAGLAARSMLTATVGVVGLGWMVSTSGGTAAAVWLSRLPAPTAGASGQGAGLAGPGKWSAGRSRGAAPGSGAGSPRRCSGACGSRQRAGWRDQGRPAGQPLARPARPQPGSGHTAPTPRAACAPSAAVREWAPGRQPVAAQVPPGPWGRGFGRSNPPGRGVGARTGTCSHRTAGGRGAAARGPAPRRGGDAGPQARPGPGAQVPEPRSRAEKDRRSRTGRPVGCTVSGINGSLCGRPASAGSSEAAGQS